VRAERRWGAPLCASLLALLVSNAACRRAPPRKNDAPAAEAASTVGRSWVTPPFESADGGLIAARLPQIVYRGGPFLRNPRVVTVTFKGDDAGVVTRLETFGDTITRSAWWRTVVDSYCTDQGDCIGEGQPGAHARLEAALPPNVRDVEVEELLTREAAAGRLGPIDASTLLAVYLPEGVSLSDAFVPRYCAGGPRAFHRALTLGESKVPFAVIPRCSDEAELTATASHELLETTTNPDPSERGFAFEQGSKNIAFTASGVEAVDPCGLLTMDGHWTFESGFVVQRAWSNRAAALGRDPCVPARADRPYLALVPSEPAVRLAEVGASVTLTVEARADRAVPRWAISAFDLSGHHDHDRFVDLILDRPTIEAGETAQLTITVRKLNPKQLTLVALVSTLGVQSHMWPLAVMMR
jgi:hypothetical protein